MKRKHRYAGAVGAVLMGLAGCGGSTVDNPPGAGGQQLSYAYFQKCINPIFLAALPITLNGVTSINTCAGSGCHANSSGAGGALRLVPSAVALDVTNTANTPDVIRASDMYKNFVSARAAVVLGSVTQSRLIAKPLLLGVLHGGGLIFASDQDPNVKLMQYWISHPVPVGQDEFSTAAYSMFTPADPNAGTCNTQ